MTDGQEENSISRNGKRGKGDKKIYFCTIYLLLFKYLLKINSSSGMKCRFIMVCGDEFH